MSNVQSMYSLEPATTPVHLFTRTLRYLFIVSSINTPSFHRKATSHTRARDNSSTLALRCSLSLSPHLPRKPKFQSDIIPPLKTQNSKAMPDRIV